jgi:hypothetical protein
VTMTVMIMMMMMMILMMILMMMIMMMMNFNIIVVIIFYCCYILLLLLLLLPWSWWSIQTKICCQSHTFWQPMETLFEGWGLQVFCYSRLQKSNYAFFQNWTK